MKKFIIALSAFALCINLSYAETTPTSSVSMAAYKVVNSNAVRVIVVSPTQENVTIHIKDQTGRVIFTDVIRNQDKFSRKYIFNEASPNSNYTIEVVNSQGTASQNVSL